MFRCPASARSAWMWVRLAPWSTACLKKSKAERVGSARELLAELEALLPGRKGARPGRGGEPVCRPVRLPGGGRGALLRPRSRDRRHDGAAAQPAAPGRRRALRGRQVVVRARGGDPGLEGIRGPLGSVCSAPRAPSRCPRSSMCSCRSPEAESASSAATGPPELPDHDELLATLRSQPGYLGVRLRARCRRAGPGHRILVFVDQFEELYTLGAAPEERAAFVACLEGCGRRRLVAPARPARHPLGLPRSDGRGSSFHERRDPAGSGSFRRWGATACAKP